MRQIAKRPHPKDSRTAWTENWRSFWHGPRPGVVHDDFCTGRINQKLKRRLTIKINALLNVWDFMKIGKTGDSYIRSDMVDYRGTYDHMYLLYRSKSKDFVSQLESHYIRKFSKTHPAQIENIQLHSGGGMSTYDGYYYLYAVVRKGEEDE